MADVKFTVIYGYQPEMTPKIAIASDDKTVQVYSRGDREAQAAALTERLQMKLDHIKEMSAKGKDAPPAYRNVDTFRALTSNFHGGVSATSFFESFDEAAAHAQEVFSGNATE